jgi:hypothetical protein
VGAFLVGQSWLTAITLDPRVWWPLFPLLLLIVMVTLSASVVWVIRKKAPTTDVVLQSLALAGYLFTAIVAMASEGGGRVPTYVHRLPSLLTQAVLFAQLVRVWTRTDAKPLRVLNLVALGAILTDTALHYVLVRR